MTAGGADPDLYLPAAAREVLHLRDLAESSAATGEVTSSYGAAVVVWAALVGMLDDPTGAVAYAERVVASPVRAAVVPL